MVYLPSSHWHWASATVHIIASSDPSSEQISAFTLAQPWLTGADPCVSATISMVGVCGSFVTKVQNDAKLLGAATDAQIKGAASQGVQPSTQ